MPLSCRRCPSLCWLPLHVLESRIASCNSCKAGRPVLFAFMAVLAMGQWCRINYHQYIKHVLSHA